MKMFSQYEDNRNNNFNLIRLSASLIVLYTHSYALSGHLPNQQGTPIAYFIYLLGNVGVDMFFLVSGFLVTRSYIKRNDLKGFLWARMIRIYPGLLCAILFAVFIVGLFDTQLNYKDYLKHHDIYNYIAINLSLIKTVVNLPAIFEGNHYPNQINGSLWTLPAEARLYLYVALFGIVGFFNRPRTFNIIACLLIAVAVQWPAYILLISDNPLYYSPALLFIIGSLFYINKVFIPSSGFVLGLLFFCLIYTLYYQNTYKDIAYTLFLPYFVFWLAYNAPLLHFFNKLGDYSYGIYIYAFPIQQLIISRQKELNVDQFFFYSLFWTLVIAIFSWHLIEKPALRFKQ
jgi:peptidoglycan/LPS O-acetylase OafA/YrhL